MLISIVLEFVMVGIILYSLGYLIVSRNAPQEVRSLTDKGISYTYLKYIRPTIHTKKVSLWVARYIGYHIVIHHTGLPKTAAQRLFELLKNTVRATYSGGNLLCYKPLIRDFASVFISKSRNRDYWCSQCCRLAGICLLISIILML